jgi:hypothetical protein
MSVKAKGPILVFAKIIKTICLQQVINSLSLLSVYLLRYYLSNNLDRRIGSRYGD